MVGLDLGLVEIWGDYAPGKGMPTASGFPGDTQYLPYRQAKASSGRESRPTGLTREREPDALD